MSSSRCRARLDAVATAGTPRSAVGRRWGAVLLVGVMAGLVVGCRGEEPRVPVDAPGVRDGSPVARSASPAPVGATATVPGDALRPSPPPLEPPAVTAEPAAPPTEPPAPPTEAPLGPPVVPTVGGSQDPFRAESAELGPIVWATAIDASTNAPTPAVDVVPVDAPRIYASVPVGRLQRGTVLDARWTYNGTPLIGVEGTVTAERDQRGGWVAFLLSREDGEPWPAGVYAVVVSVDGVVAHASAIRAEQTGG